MDETKKCPYCGEEIKSVAVKCKHCGEFLNQAVQNEPAIKEKWYDRVWLIVVLCIIFWPIGIYGFWQHSKSPKWVKLLYSIFIILLPYILAISIFVIGDYLNNSDYSFMNESPNTEKNTEVSKNFENTIHFNSETQHGNEDFNTFINKFITDICFQSDRIHFPVKNLSNKVDTELNSTNFPIFDKDDIFEGRREFEDLATPVDGNFSKVNAREIEYSYQQDETCNAWRIRFELIDNKWFLTKYQNYTI